MELLRPSRYVAEMGRHMPGIWQRIDQLRSQRHLFGDDWPPWCFLPVGMAERLFNPSGCYVSGRSAEWGYVAATTISTLAAWRTTQGVYRFDPTIFEAVWETPLSGNLPVDFLFHLPEWCCYIETPGCESPISPGPLYGFFAWLNYNSVTKEREVVTVFDYVAGLFPLACPLSRRSLHQICEEVYALALAVHGKSILEEMELAGILEAFGKTKKQMAEAWRSDGPARVAATLTPMISLLLYLCSSAADVRNSRGTSDKPTRPRPSKTKRGPRIFPPNEPNVWEVGWRIGPALRKGLDEEARRSAGGGREGTSPRPHIRRAHWHSYWTGPVNDPSRRSLRVLWLPPISVNVQCPDELVATVRGVE